MAKAKRKISARRVFLGILIAVLVLCLAALGIFCGYYFTNGFGGALPTFLVEYDGQKHYGDGEIELHDGAEFKIGSLFREEYAVTFTAIETEEDFEFELGGEACKWSSLKGQDLTPGFAVTSTEIGFKVEYGSFTEVITRATGRQANGLTENRSAPFAMTVTCGKQSMSFKCVIGVISVTGIELPPEIQI